ncbi:Vacuolar protein sorting-associated protein 13A [Cichlidogyrus casuarinus]|uniref:Vacuolar protein sorting-associated protein 13A n=1 Tax=Cichlidogyrus casuarinus TaxID=1844966 RepID=A0ABD2QL15_9PLAT
MHCWEQLIETTPVKEFEYMEKSPNTKTIVMNLVQSIKRRRDSNHGKLFRLYVDLTSTDPTMDDVNEEMIASVKPALRTVEIISHDTLQITLTHSALNRMSYLVKACQEAWQLDLDKSENLNFNINTNHSMYTVNNQTGYTLKLAVFSDTLVPVDPNVAVDHRTLDLITMQPKKSVKSGHGNDAQVELLLHVYEVPNNHYLGFNLCDRILEDKVDKAPNLSAYFLLEEAPSNLSESKEPIWAGNKVVDRIPFDELDEHVFWKASKLRLDKLDYYGNSAPLMKETEMVATLPLLQINQTDLGQNRMTLRSSVQVYNETNMTFNIVTIDDKTKAEVKHLRLKPGDCKPLPLCFFKEKDFPGFFIRFEKQNCEYSISDSPVLLPLDEEKPTAIQGSTKSGQKNVLKKNIAGPIQKVHCIDYSKREAHNKSFVAIALSKPHEDHQIQSNPDCDKELQNLTQSPGETIPLECVDFPANEKLILEMAYLGLKYQTQISLGGQKAPTIPIILEPDCQDALSFAPAKLTQAFQDLVLEGTSHSGQSSFSLYSAYWFINKTGLDLSYKNEDVQMVEHPANVESAILFSLPKSRFFVEKISIRINGSDWSDRFSLDSVGSTGRIICKHSAQKRAYYVGVNIELSSNGLTKILTFLPYFFVISKIPVSS